MATIAVSSTGLTSVNVTATENDNDVQSLVVTPTALTVTEGGSGTFAVSLSHQPASDVTVTLVSNGDSDITTGVTTLTFTTANWNAAQNVTVNAAEDGDLANGVATIAVSSTGLTSVNVTATENDNDVQSLVVTPTALTVAEGSSGTFAVSLSQQPASNVTVAIARITGDTDLTVNGGASLTFTSGNWNIAQTVTLAAEEDVDLANGSAIFDVTSSGLATVSVTGTELDNDQRLSKPTVTNIPRYPESDSPTVTWQAVTAAVSYNVWLTRRFPAVSRVLLSESAVTTTSFTPSANLDPGYYKFWVQAIDANGVGGTWSNVETFEIRPDLGTPTIASFTSPPTFTWTAIPNAPGYELYIRTTDGTNTIIDDITTTSYTPTQALSQSEGRWWIRSSDAIGNRGWSFVGTFGIRTEVLSPAGTQSSSIPTFNWVAVAAAGRYILHVTNLDTNTVAIREDNLTDASYTPSTALASGNYRVWVKAIDGTTDLFSSGAWSRPVDFTIAAADATESSATDGSLQLVLSSLNIQKIDPEEQNATSKPSENDVDIRTVSDGQTAQADPNEVAPEALIQVTTRQATDAMSVLDALMSNDVLLAATLEA